MSNNRLSEQDQTFEAKTWDLPNVETDVVVDSSVTNAFNKPLSWKYEPPEDEEVDDLKPLTAEDIEAIRQSAYEEGFALGHSEGHEKGLEEGTAQGIEQGITEGKETGLAEGLAQAQEEIEALTLQFKTLLSAMTQPLASVEKNLEQELVILSVKLAEAVINKEVNSSQEVLLNAISEGIKVLPINEKQYQMHMHPDDVQFVNEHYGQETLQQNHWQVLENSSMSRGGCQITTNNNSVDVSIEKRCRDVFAQFLLDQGLSNDPRAS